MPYRDEREALRARLEATEQRLRDAESALAKANHRAAEAEKAGAARARVGQTPRDAATRRRVSRDSDEPGREHVWVRSVAVFWSCAGVLFVVWQVSLEPHLHLGSVLAALATGLLLFAAPSAVVVWRTGDRRRPSAPAGTRRVNVRVDIAGAGLQARGNEPPSAEPLDSEVDEEDSSHASPSHCARGAARFQARRVL